MARISSLLENYMTFIKERTSTQGRFIIENQTTGTLRSGIQDPGRLFFFKEKITPDGAY